MKIKFQTWFLFSAIAALSLVIWIQLSYSQLTIVDLSVKKSEALAIAKDYLKKNYQIHDNNFKHATVFITDYNADNYLQRSLGFKKEKEFVRKHDFDLFLWLIRFFKENEKEEFRLTVSASTGQITSLKHVIEDSDKREAIDQEKAKEKAEKFITEYFKRPLDQYTLQAVNQRNFDNRIDYSFNWRKKDVAIAWSNQENSGTAKLITGITVSGNEILSFFKNSLDLPDQFTRFISKKKHTGERLSFIFLILYIGIIAAAIATIISRQHHLVMHVSKKFFIILTFALFALNIVDYVNDFQVVLFNYDSTSSMREYLITYFSNITFNSFILTISILMPSLAGESLQRELWPQKKEGSFLHYIASSFFTRSISQSILLGYLVAIMLLGLQSIIFAIGFRYLGVWLERSWVTQLSSSCFPFLAAFIMSVRASFIEEITFRLFAIGWFKKITKNTILAVIFASIFWGFGHSQYLIFPMWFRGIEITCLGFLLSYIFLRYGIIPALVAHYIFDVFWGSAGFLIGKTTPFNFYTTLFVLFLPLFWGLIGFILNKSDQENELRWKLNKHQLFNLQVLKQFINNPLNAQNKTNEELRTELIKHGWDVAVIDSALAEKINKPLN